MIVAYCQEDAESAFARLFMTFHHEPQIYMLPHVFGAEIPAPDKKLLEVVNSMFNKPAGLNTNFNRCMDMMLAELLRRRIESETPIQPMLMVFTDMQFDSAHGSGGGNYETNLDATEARYAEAGIPMPIIVFWNVRGCGSQAAVAAQPSRKNVVMLSGFSANLMEDFFKMLESGRFSDYRTESFDLSGEEEENELDTNNVVRVLLESEMYGRYKFFERK